MPGSPEFHITINGHPFTITQDTVLVGRLKELGNVPATDDLNLVLPTGLKPLADDEQIHLRENMEFVSSVRSGQSS